MASNEIGVRASSVVASLSSFATRECTSDSSGPGSRVSLGPKTTKNYVRSLLSAFPGVDVRLLGILLD